MCVAWTQGKWHELRQFQPVGRKQFRVTRQESPKTDHISGAPALVYKPPAKWDEMSFADRSPMRDLSTLEHVLALRQHHAKLTQVYNKWGKGKARYSTVHIPLYTCSYKYTYVWYIYVYIYMYVCIYIYTFIYIYVYICIYLYVYIYIYIYIYVYIYICMQVYLCIRMYLYIHTYTLYICTYTRAYIHLYNMYVCVCIDTCVCIGIDTVRVYTLLYRYIYTLAIVHTHLNIHQYLCVRTWTHRLPDQLTNCDKKEVAHWWQETHSIFHYCQMTYRAATISRLLKITGLFCRISSLLLLKIIGLFCKRAL